MCKQVRLTIVFKALLVFPAVETGLWGVDDHLQLQVDTVLLRPPRYLGVSRAALTTAVVCVVSGQNVSSNVI